MECRLACHAAAVPDRFTSNLNKFNVSLRTVGLVSKTVTPRIAKLLNVRRRVSDTQLGDPLTERGVQGVEITGKSTRVPSVAVVVGSQAPYTLFDTSR